MAVSQSALSREKTVCALAAMSEILGELRLLKQAGSGTRWRRGEGTKEYRHPVVLVQQKKT